MSFDQQSSGNFTFVSGNDGEFSLSPTSDLRICIFFGAGNLAICLRHPDGRSEQTVLPPRTMLAISDSINVALKWGGAADVLIVSVARKLLVSVADSLRLAKPPLFGVTRIADPVIQNISGMIQDLFSRDQEIPEAVAASATQLLAVRFLSQVGRGDAASVRERLSPSALRRTMEFVDHHLMDEFDLEDMANAAGCSRFHFARAFRSSTGTSPWRYVTGRRLREAEELLRTREKLSVAEVCHMVGFQDQSHFTRAFKNVFAVTPGDFRRRLASKAA